MNEQNTTVIPARPMNETAVKYPVCSPAFLSTDAQHLYRQGRRSHILDHDVFETVRRRGGYITPAEAKNFQPTVRMISAIRELEDAGLATYGTSSGPKLLVNRVHDQYTVAFGRGSQFVRVSTFSTSPDDSELLAVLVGADLENRNSHTPGISELAVRSRHANATDVEHDTASTALLVLQNTSQPVFTGYGLMRIHGVLSEAHLYPLGVDPLTQSDGDTRASDGVCTQCREPHGFAPFLPPRAAWLSGPLFATVETLPLRPYLVAEPPIGWC